MLKEALDYLDGKKWSTKIKEWAGTLEDSSLVEQIRGSERLGNSSQYYLVTAAMGEAASLVIAAVPTGQQFYEKPVFYGIGLAITLGLGMAGMIRNECRLNILRNVQKDRDTRLKGRSLTIELLSSKT